METTLREPEGAEQGVPGVLENGQASEEKRLAADAARQQRDRLLVLALVLLILALSLIYARVAAKAAAEIAIRNARARNQATAQLGARLIEAQCEAALAVLKSLARHPGQMTNASHLQEAVELIPDLALVALYGRDGRLRTSTPRFPRPPARAVGQDWYERVSATRAPTVSDVYPTGGRQGEQAIVLTVPVGPRADPAGYLMALYRLRVVNEWLEPLHVGGDTLLYVLDGGGRLVAASGGRREWRESAAGSEAARQALIGRYGSIEDSDLEGRERILLSYAPAKVPGWAVLAVQPRDAALAAADHLSRRLSLLVVPVLALMLGAGWSIERLYRRQARLARQNAALSRHLVVQNERLRAADRAKSEFLANVSHDLRTPLASIKASVSGLLEPDIHWDHASLRGFLTLVNEETDRLAARVRNLLDMARLESGALPMQKEPCDVTDVVSSALERLQPLLRGREIDAEFPPEPLLVEADYAQIETVIVNLLENALKYSPPATPLHLRGVAQRECDGALFVLRDEGPGLQPGDEERIFEKFYRAPGKGAASGTGLGLAICKAIVTAHGGRIGARAAPEGGAELWFELPLYAAPGSPVTVSGHGANPGSR
jgi:signal transduction histidine kinase